MPGRAAGVVHALGAMPQQVVAAARGAVFAIGAVGALLLDPAALRPSRGEAGAFEPVDAGALYTQSYSSQWAASWLPEAGVAALAGSRGVQLCSDHGSRAARALPPRSPLAWLDAYDVFGEVSLGAPSVHLAAGHGDAAVLVHVDRGGADGRIWIFVEPSARARACVVAGAALLLPVTVSLCSNGAAACTT